MSNPFEDFLKQQESPEPIGDEETKKLSTEQLARQDALFKKMQAEIKVAKEKIPTVSKTDELIELVREIEAKDSVFASKRVAETIENIIWGMQFRQENPLARLGTVPEDGGIRKKLGELLSAKI